MTRQMRSMTRLIWIATLLLLTVIAPATAAPSATAEGERGMVVSAQHEASEAGRRILEAGGNAVDAAVAVGYALAVVDPCCGNIGGGGFVLGEPDAASLARAERLGKNPEAARIFLHQDGSPYRAGDRLVQSDLAATLALIAEHGPDIFYRGPIAAAVATASAAQGGILTTEDFAAYTVAEAPPVGCAYRRYKILSAPPPSAGGTILCEMLNVLSGWDLAASGAGSAATVHLMTETMRHAYVDRNSVLGDPAFVTNPLERLLSPEHAAAIRAMIDPNKATASASLGPGTAPHERLETTHYSVADGAGNAVAVTYTLNGNFGAAVVAPGTGFLLNNEMDDFAAKPGTPNLFGLVQGSANSIAPGKRPLSSMTPTIVEQDGRPVLVLGSPGGPRITTAVLEILTGIIDFGLAPQQAVAAPRFHHQWLPDTLYYERGGLPAEVLATLAERGHRPVEQSSWGTAALIPTGPGRHPLGGNAPRRPGGAGR